MHLEKTSKIARFCGCSSRTLPHKHQNKEPDLSVCLAFQLDQNPSSLSAGPTAVKSVTSQLGLHTGQSSAWAPWMGPWMGPNG